MTGRGIGLILTLAAAQLFAVDGTVVNRTTGKPQPNATVTLYKLGQAGMESLESVKSGADGKFQIGAAVTPGPHLLQAAFENITYNRMLPPGSATTGVEIEVYASTKNPASVKVRQHVFVLEPVNGKLQVAENISYDNSGNASFNDPAGSVQVYLPTEAKGKAHVMCEGPKSVPIERTPTPDKTPNIYRVDFPLKPGETRIQLTYEMALPSPPIWSVKLLHPAADTRLATPSGVTLKGDGIKQVGREPRTQAAIYEVSGQEIRAEIEGSGSLRDSEPESEAPGIVTIKPRIYDRLPVVLGISGAILLLAFLLLYRSRPADGK